VISLLAPLVGQAEWPRRSQTCCRHPLASVNRSLKKAPFIVLIDANMLSIFTEISFVSLCERV